MEEGCLLSLPSGIGHASNKFHLSKPALTGEGAFGQNGRRGAPPGRGGTGNLGRPAEEARPGESKSGPTPGGLPPPIVDKSAERICRPNHPSPSPEFSDTLALPFLNLSWPKTDDQRSSHPRRRAGFAPPLCSNPPFHRP